MGHPRERGSDAVKQSVRERFIRAHAETCRLVQTRVPPEVDTSAAVGGKASEA